MLKEFSAPDITVLAFNPKDSICEDASGVEIIEGVGEIGVVDGNIFPID